MKCIAIFAAIALLTPYFAQSDENVLILKIKPDEIKTIEFPLGTKIKIYADGCKIWRGTGIKNGGRFLFINIWSKEGGIVKIKYELPSHPFITKDEYDFLIITPSKWKEILQPLKEHKEKYGIKTIIVSLDEIYGGKYFATQGRDDAEKVKYFIKDAIENWGIEYVMLVGGRKFSKEEWIMPIRYAWLNDRSSSWEYERRFLSDLYFADIYDANGSFSSWDTNRNGCYGEYDHEIGNKKLKDDVDLYPDVYIGRLPARTKNELRRVVQNIISYEEQSQNFKKVVLIGGDLYLHDPWDIAEGEYLLDEIAKEMNSYNIVKLYASNGLNAKMINDEIKNADFVVFEGAGAHHLWATHAKNDEKWIYYYAWNILQIRNEKLPIVLTAGARLGQFNQSRECFSWLFVSKGKSVASIGPTGLCWIGHGENITKIFLGNLHIRLCKEIAKKDLLGKAWGNAIISYLNSFKWEGVAKAFHMKAVEELEIFGDPTLKIGGYSYECNLQRKLHVGGDGEGNYSKIQDAINDANNGDIIIVHPGIYEEDLIVNKSVELIGINATIKTNGMKLEANSIKIRNFSIVGYEKGIGLECNGNEITIENNYIRAFNYSILLNGSNCIVKSNDIHGNICGIWINGNDCFIEGNELHNNWYGVWIENGRNESIENNYFHFNHWYALWVEGKDGTIIANNFSRNWYSIYLYNSNDFIISENFIYRNQHGPQFVNSSNNIFESNDVRKNEHYGIYFGWRSKGNVITKNNFIGNAYNARDDDKNKWQANYWDDYIGLKIKILWLLHIPKYIPKLSFDWTPALKPYKM